ncbi:hypothetical protein B0H19DRAFT_1077398 [Mycena capillaripes]|nr:hypothetical protein B0H19DRAFT_1077398 [Mycena capillaripes]
MKKLQAKAGKVFRRFSRVRAREGITDSSHDPILPPELERVIFELVAANDALPHQHAGKTTLAIAQNWIEPFIYERVSLYEYNHRAFLATIAARPASFFAAHVKHLYFDDDHGIRLYAAMWPVLKVCTGAVSVGCYYPYRNLAALLAPLPLQRLVVSRLTLPSTPADLPPWATSLTHLGLSNALLLEPTATLAALPALSHLVVDWTLLAHAGAGAVGFETEQRQPYIVLAGNAEITEDQWWPWTLRFLCDGDFSGDPQFYTHVRLLSDGTWSLCAEARNFCAWREEMKRIRNERV